jgi:hypothetical protein
MVLQEDNYSWVQCTHARACYLYCLEKGCVDQYEKYVSKKVNYMKRYNKKVEVVEKEKLKYLPGKKANHVGESPRRLPDTDVSPLCHIFSSSHNFLSQLFLHCPVRVVPRSGRLQPLVFKLCT